MGFGYTEESMSIELEAREVEGLFERLSQKQLPFLPPMLAGLDGTTQTLKISNGLMSIAYEWWEDIPNGFEVLEQIRKELFGLAGLNIKEILQ